MDLVRSRYTVRGLQSSQSQTAIPDVLENPTSRDVAFNQLFTQKCPIELMDKFKINNLLSKGETRWQPQSHCNSARVRSPERVGITNPYFRAPSPVIHLHGASGKLYELDGLRMPEIYSAARNSLYTRYTPNEWTRSHTLHLSNSDQTRRRAQEARGMAERIGQETYDNISRAEEEVNRLLGERISDVHQLKLELNKEINSLTEEMDRLSEAKRVAEKALSETENPLHVTQECLYEREKRQSIDLVHDAPEKLLLTEVQTVKECQNQLKEVIGKATGQLSLCRAVRHELEKDASDKFNAIQLDELAHQLRNSSSGIAYHCGSLRNELGMSVPENWRQHTMANLRQSQIERAASRKLRECIDLCLASVMFKMRDRWSASTSALAMRAQEIAEARNQLQVQLTKVSQEVFDIEQNMEYLKQCIQAKQSPLKVAQTRLDLRNRRLNVEFCHDDPHSRLVQEVGQLQEVVDQLTKQLTKNQLIHQDLLKVRAQLETDLAVKSNSLFIDREKCLGLRKTFPMSPASLSISNV